MAESPRPLVERIKDEDSVAAVQRVTATFIDDLRLEFLARLADLVGDVASLRSLLRWLVGTFVTVTMTLIVVSIQLATR